MKKLALSVSGIKAEEKFVKMSRKLETLTLCVRRRVRRGGSSEDIILPKEWLISAVDLGTIVRLKHTGHRPIIGHWVTTYATFASSYFVFLDMKIMVQSHKVINLQQNF